MVSLTTVYVLSLIVAGVAGMSSAFAGNKFFPIKGGDIGLPPPTPEEVNEQAERTAELAKRLSEATIEDKVESPSTEQTSQITS